MYIPITMIITLKISASSAPQPDRRFDNIFVTFTATTTCPKVAPRSLNIPIFDIQSQLLQ